MIRNIVRDFAKAIHIIRKAYQPSFLAGQRLIRMTHHSGPNYLTKSSNMRQARWAISCFKQNLVLGPIQLFNAAGKGSGSEASGDEWAGSDDSDVDGGEWKGDPGSRAKKKADEKKKKEEAKRAAKAEKEAAGGAVASSAANIGARTNYCVWDELTFVVSCTRVCACLAYLHFFAFCLETRKFLMFARSGTQ